MKLIHEIGVDGRTLLDRLNRMTDPNKSPNQDQTTGLLVV